MVHVVTADIFRYLYVCKHRFVRKFFSSLLYFSQEMKAMIYQAVEEAPAVDSVEEDILKRHFANFDESFFNYCDKELKKINTFYAEKLAEATRKFATLNNELKIALDGVQKSGKGKPHQMLKKKSLPYKKIQV